MNHIDKSTHQAEGDGIIDELLEVSWVDDQNRYVNADYNTCLSTDRLGFRNRFINVLLQNQHHYCCYCMKSIDRDDTTLEHIIPQNVSDRERYNEYMVCDELSRHVVFSPDFIRDSKIIPPSKYPHDIAYYNIVASCDSNDHCNHHRSDTYVYPLFFDPLAANEVEYDGQGRAYSPEYDDDLAVLGLTTTPELVIYRRLWSEFSKTKESPEEVTDDDIELLVLTIHDSNRKFTKRLENFYGTPSKRNELLKYKWFFYYYKSFQAV